MMVGLFGGEVVPVSAFVDAGVGAFAAGWVKSFGEFDQGDLVGWCGVCACGGEIPGGR